jgi:hypothetical protein
MPTRARKTRSNRTRATETGRTGTKPRAAKRRAAKKATSARTSSGRAGTRGASPRRSHGSSHGKRKWSASVDTESTYPQEGLFKQDAATIARSLASKKVSPKGPSSGMRMLTFYVNRAGKNLSKSRLRVLERAKELLHERMAKRKR